MLTRLAASVLLSLTVVACGSSNDGVVTDEGDTGGSGVGGAFATGGGSAAGGAKDAGRSDSGATGGAKGTGGTTGTGGTGGAGNTGGAKGTGGTTGTGGTGTGGATGTGGTVVVGDGGPGLCSTGSWTLAGIPPEGTSNVTYLSDLTPTQVNEFSSFGGAATHNVHADRSYTGKALVINNVCYPKGLGVHTYTEITYDLGGTYTQFLADTGLDYLENSASMIFEVKLDGNLVYDKGQGTMTKDQVAPVTLDVTGKQSMMLYVRDAFDDATDDYGVWGGARLVK